MNPHLVTVTVPDGRHLIVELNPLPSEGDVSQHVADDQRRRVVRVEQQSLANGTRAMVELSTPIPPEGAWSLANPNFPSR